MNQAIWNEEGVSVFYHNNVYLMRFATGSESLRFSKIQEARKEFIKQLSLRRARK